MQLSNVGLDLGHLMSACYVSVAEGRRVGPESTGEILSIDRVSTIPLRRFVRLRQILRNTLGKRLFEFVHELSFISENMKIIQNQRSDGNAH